MIQYTKIIIKEKNISMKEKQVLELANILGYHIEKKTIYGVNNGYHFSLNLLSNKKIPTYQVSILVNKVMTLDNIKTIRKELQSVVSMNEEHNAFLLQALINFPKENENKKDFFIEFMNTLTKALQKENIDDYNRCLFCNDDKEKEEKEWVVIRKLYVLSHQSCAEEELKTTKEKSNRLKMSLLGGIIGAFIGFVPAFLALIFADYFIGVLYALSPICAYLGYTLGKAPLKWYTTLCVAISSFLATIVATICFLAILANTNGESLIGYIRNPNNQCYTIVLQSILFDIIGIFISWGFITRTKNH